MGLPGGDHRSSRLMHASRMVQERPTKEGNGPVGESIASGVWQYPSKAEP